jgi:hypothetical protein
MLSFSISYPDLIKFPSFAYTTIFKEGFGDERRPKDRMDDFTEKYNVN